MATLLQVTPWAGIGPTMTSSSLSLLDACTDTATHTSTQSTHLHWPSNAQ